MTMKMQQLGRAIKRLQTQNHWRLDAALRDIGTSLAHWDALRAIANNPGVSAHHLAQETFQTDQSFGTLANRMIAKGLIERQAGAGRALAHRLTPAGESMLAQGSAVAEQVVSASFAGLQDEEHAELFRLINKALAASQKQ